MNGANTYTTEYKKTIKAGAVAAGRTYRPNLLKRLCFANIENGLKREFNDRTGKILSALPTMSVMATGRYEEAYDEGGIKYIRYSPPGAMKSFQSYMRRRRRNKAKQRVTALRNMW